MTKSGTKRPLVIKTSPMQFIVERCFDPGGEFVRKNQQNDYLKEV